MKFKVGDKVRIKTDLVADQDFPNCFMDEEMLEYRGKIAEITEVDCDGDYILDIDNELYYWDVDMLEEVNEVAGVKEVKRIPLIGEYIKIVNADISFGDYENGDILKVIGLYSGDGDVKIEGEDKVFVSKDEYVVLEGYKPPKAEESKVETVHVQMCMNCKHYNIELSKEPCSKCSHLSMVTYSDKDYWESPINVQTLVKQLKEPVVLLPKDIDVATLAEPDAIYNPSHYCYSKYQPIDVIREWKLNFNLGNVVKYVERCGHKDEPIQELKKARQYLQHEIDRLENEI